MDEKNNEFREDQQKLEYSSHAVRDIFGSMRDKLNTYWANLASIAAKDPFERDILFTANIANRELRKRIKIKHLL